MGLARKGVYNGLTAAILKYFEIDTKYGIELKLEKVALPNMEFSFPVLSQRNRGKLLVPNMEFLIYI